MQNKQAIIGIIAAVVILAGAVGVFLYSQNKNDSEPTATVATDESKETTSLESNLASILKSGKTQECTFTYADESGNSTSGTAYIAGQNMRTEVTSSTNGKSSTIYVVRNEDENYIWGSDFPNNTGLKMTMSIDEYVNNEDSKKYFDPNLNAEYDCSDWTADTTIFTPPTNIKFQDISAMMQGVMKGASNAPTGTAASSECSICNSLSGDAKTACMKQFSC
ncbi:MAG: hypothetical protein KBD51_01195 [Candidatus Levybacteria bacterium]|nr:hypothetical protein [Candidatus Levybacteria bacterium]